MSDSARPGKADLHIHTLLSDGLATPQEVLDYTGAETDLDVVAVTDHDHLLGAHAAREVWARGRYRFQLIAGMEVTAIEGHVIALFIEEPLPSLRPVAEVLEAIHRQGGLAIAAHPMTWLTRALGRRAFESIASSPHDGVYLDGLETANRSFGVGAALRKATELNRERYHLAEVGGSDAHFLKTIGTAYTEFPGHTTEELRRSILERTCRGVMGPRPTLLEIGPWQLARQAWRGITVTPRTFGWVPTARSFVRRIFTVR